MPKINEEQAKEFLNKISEKDNVAIIHHDDGDGFCSGIIFQDHCKALGAKTKTFNYNFSETSLETLLLEPFNKIIITDISSKATQEEIKSIKEKEIFYCDHHPEYPLPKKTLALLTADQGYIPSSRTAYELTGRKKWLAMIGTITDSGDLYKENQKFINDFLKEQGLTLEKFKTKYSHVISNAIVYFANTPEKMFQILAKIDSLEEIKKLEKYSDEVEKDIQKAIGQCETTKEKLGNANLYYMEPKYRTRGAVAAIISRENPEGIHLLVSPESSDNKILRVSARHSSEEADLPKLLEAAMEGLENVSYGGHPRASAGQFQAKDLEKFKQNIRNYFLK